jgi:hypothetical protein
VGDKGDNVAVLSDSNCLVSSHQVAGCYDFMAALLERVVEVKCGVAVLRILHHCTTQPSRRWNITRVKQWAWLVVAAIKHGGSVGVFA